MAITGAAPSRSQLGARQTERRLLREEILRQFRNRYVVNRYGRGPQWPINLCPRRYRRALMRKSFAVEWDHRHQGL